MAVTIIIAISALFVLAIGYVAVGQETVNLGDTPTRSFFDIDEAVDYVADTMPAEVASRLTYEELELLIRWQVTYFRERGVATFGGIDHAAEDASQLGVISIADEDEIVDVLLARAAAEPMDLVAVDAVVVVDLTADYLAQIGAVGQAVDEDELTAIAQAQKAAALDHQRRAALEAAGEEGWGESESEGPEPPAS